MYAQNVRIVQELCHAGAIVSFKNNEGKTALQIAKTFQRHDIVSFLSRHYQKTL